MAISIRAGRVLEIPLAAALLALLMSGSLLAQGRFAVTYNEPPAQFREVVDVVVGAGVVEEATQFVNSALRLPRVVPVIFDSCGVPNAFYDPEARRIVFCYEFLALFDQMFAQDPEFTAEELDEAILGSTLFFLLHEMGHALVHILDLPITGREEDAVDDLAALILIEADAREDLISAAYSFDLLAAHLEASGAELAFWDEHSLSAQRAYALTCMVYGSDPEVFGDLVSPDILPEARAVRCPREFGQKSESWDRLLDPYFLGE